MAIGRFHPRSWEEKINIFSPIVLRVSPESKFAGASILGRKGRPVEAAPGDSLLVGTIRMGYGHYRMARAAVTWGLRAGSRVFVHDPLLINSIESSALKMSERVYSDASRISSALGGPFERAWGSLMKSGGKGAQESSRKLARKLTRLMGDLPREWPMVCAYPLNAQMAVLHGCRRVINLIPDSYPQHFFVVPGALSVTQNEESRQALLALGVRPENAITAGHWVPEELAENAIADGEARLSRLRRAAPLRLLFSVGGAGAQSAYLEALFDLLSAQTRKGRLRLIINTGDHAKVADRFERALSSAGLSVKRIRGQAACDDFIAKHPLEGKDSESEAVIFSTDGPLEAVTVTDQLMRISDVLVTKPSELAFFPLPKLHIRRVGDHEAASAIYSAGLGDGTPELREPAAAAAEIERWLRDPALFERILEGVRSASLRGVYSGAKVAVELALEKAIS
jgi:hypothetical protein